MCHLEVVIYYTEGGGDQTHDITTPWAPVGAKNKLDKAAIKTAKSFALNCKYFVQTPTCVIIKS